MVLWPLKKMCITSLKMEKHTNARSSVQIGFRFNIIGRWSGPYQCLCPFSVVYVADSVRTLNKTTSKPYTFFDTNILSAVSIHAIVVVPMCSVAAPPTYAQYGNGRHCTYLTFKCRWICNFFSICSMGNCGTSYGAEISFGNGSTSRSFSDIGTKDASLPARREKREKKKQNSEVDVSWWH